MTVGVLCGMSCSSSGSSDGSADGAAYSATNCPGQGIPGTSECTSCLNSYCAAEVSTVAMGCSASVLSCACPASAATSNTCSASQACDVAGNDLVTCEAAHCASACRGSGGPYGSQD